MLNNNSKGNNSKEHIDLGFYTYINNSIEIENVLMQYFFFII